MRRCTARGCRAETPGLEGQPSPKSGSDTSATHCCLKMEVFAKEPTGVGCTIQRGAVPRKRREDMLTGDCVLVARVALNARLGARVPDMHFAVTSPDRKQLPVRTDRCCQEGAPAHLPPAFLHPLSRAACHLWLCASRRGCVQNRPATHMLRSAAGYTPLFLRVHGRDIRKSRRQRELPPSCNSSLTKAHAKCRGREGISF